MVRSYVKIYGPPFMTALKSVEKVAQDMGAKMNQPAKEDVVETLVKKTGDILGDYDYFFEWKKDPTKAEVQELIEKLDAALAGCGCRYTLVTK